MDDREIYEIRFRRLRQLVQMLFTGHQTKFAEAIGKKNTYVNFLLADPEKPHHKNLGSEMARHIERSLGLPIGWLDSSGDEPPVRPRVVAVEQQAPEGFLFVPRVSVRLSAGGGALAFEEEKAPPLAFRKEWLDRNGLRVEKLVAAEATGDSMLPRIHDGDTLLIDTSEVTPRDGHVYAMRTRDMLRVKRIYCRTRGLVLHSDNPAYPPEELPVEDLEQLHIIGRVVWVSGGI